jgi:serine/threonine-protein kinase
MLGQTLLDKYRVLRQLDEGGMSKIFLARPLSGGGEVVVKVMKESLRDQDKVREHFRREIHIMSRFNHPNAVALYDADLNDKRSPVLVMEYLRGVDLAELLKRDGKFNPERTGRLLAQLCDVLQAAHDAGIVHRDLKPANLMIVHPSTPLETLKLMDFGLAKMPNLLFFSAHDLVDVSLPGASGTPEYISPEQALASDMDRRSDIYSVGVILFELLTGRRPFERPTVEGLLEAHICDQPPSFTAMGLRGEVSPAVEAVVRSCLAKYPEDRPATAADLAQRYEQALGKPLARNAARNPENVFKPIPGRSSGLRPAVQAAPTSSGLRPAVTAPGTSSGLRPAVEKGSGSGLYPTVPIKRASNASTVRHNFAAYMPDALALIKLKGFIHDMGGEVVESLPGLIRVRVPWRQASKVPVKKGGSGLFAWAKQAMGGNNAVQAPLSTMEIDIQMERLDPTQPGQLTLSVSMRSSDGMMSLEGREQCQKLNRDLQAYLMGR